MTLILERLAFYRAAQEAGTINDAYEALAGELGVERSEAIRLARQARAAVARSAATAAPDAAPDLPFGFRAVPLSSLSPRMLFAAAGSCVLVAAASAGVLLKGGGGTGIGWGWGLGGGAGDNPDPNANPNNGGDNPPADPNPGPNNGGDSECAAILEVKIGDLVDALDWEEARIAELEADQPPACKAWHEANVKAMEDDLGAATDLLNTGSIDAQCAMVEKLTAGHAIWYENGPYPGNNLGPSPCVDGGGEGEQEEGNGQGNGQGDDAVPECVDLGGMITAKERADVLALIKPLMPNKPVPVMVENSFPLGVDKRYYYMDAAVLTVQRWRGRPILTTPYATQVCVFSRPDVVELRAAVAAAYDAL